MLYTEEAVKANIRNREGKRVFYLAKEDTLTPGARDWLRGEHVEIVDSEKAKAKQYKLLGGSFTDEKPEQMTHLNAEVLVAKTHPRIKFRGAMDTLEAEMILAMIEADKRVSDRLSELLALARRIIRCDVLEEELHVEKLCGLTENEIRTRSHRPQDFYGVPHFMPEYTDGVLIARLNRVRCAVREAELYAVDAFSDRDGCLVRSDIIRALNRMSSMVYILMIEIKSGDEKWKSQPWRN